MLAFWQYLTSYPILGWPMISILVGSVVLVAAFGTWAQARRRASVVSVVLALATGIALGCTVVKLSFLGAVVIFLLPPVGTWLTMIAVAMWSPRARVWMAISVGTALALISPWVGSLVLDRFAGGAGT